jgi:superfamily II DNA/RNA helicase
MTLEQLDKHLENALTEAGILSLNPLQQAIISRVKQGGDAVFIAGKQSGKSTGIGLTSIIKAPKAFEGSPRVLILSPTIDSVHTLHKSMSTWTRRTEIAVEIAHDKGNMVQERNNIFDGADIIVGNTKRIMDLYIQNGIHVGQLSLFIIEDASEIMKDPLMPGRILRLAESLPKCQKLVFTSEMTPRVEKLIEDLCTHPKVMEFENPVEN